AALPALLADARTAVESSAAGALLPTFVTRVRAAAAAVDTLRTYLAGWRNLGEQAVRIGLARVQEIAVRAQLEVTGGIALETLIAHIFTDIDGELSPRMRFLSLAERRAVAADPADIYDGPLLRRGFLAGEPLDAVRPTVIYTSDILRIIMRRGGATGTGGGTGPGPANKCAGRGTPPGGGLLPSHLIHNHRTTARPPGVPPH